MSAPETLTTEDGRRIAYHRTRADGEGAGRPGIVFLGGFRSDMTGTKAVHLERWAQAKGRAFLRFDYTGHGASSGAFLDGCIGDWARDAADALAALTEGPQILVGSSMGGWIALLCARQRPARIAGLVGISAAPDFTEDSIWTGLSEAQRMALMRDGQFALPSDYADEPYIITRRLIEDGRRHLVLRDALALPFPVRLLHGTADADVALTVPLRLIDHADGPDIRLTLVKDAEHRFSLPAELDLIEQAVAELSR
ncbi:MAG: alpha/beta hydrolase [Pseudomonadota bacterium]